MSLSKRVYYVNSINRTSGTTENFSYLLQIPQSEEFNRVVVLNVSIPTTFYLIQDGFNTFIMREDGVDRTITIPVGNYSAKVFANVLVPLLNATAPLGWVYSMTIPNSNTAASTGKITYSVTGNSTQPSIVTSDNVNEQLGFSSNAVSTFEDNKLVSTTIVNFSGESTLYIHSNIANDGATDVLQEIFTTNSDSLSYIAWQCLTPEMYSKPLQTNQANVFQFSLTNEKREILNLNGVNMQITLCLFKEDDTNDLIQKYIKYRVHSEKQQYIVIYLL